MDGSNRLEWVKHNRTPRSRTTAAGAAITMLVEKVWSDDVEPAEEAAAALADVGDDEFRRHCRVAKWQSGVLTIEVDEFALVPLMRLQWAGQIRSAWPQSGLRQPLKRIKFEHGTSGIPIAR